MQLVGSVLLVQFILFIGHFIEQLLESIYPGKQDLQVPLYVGIEIVEFGESSFVPFYYNLHVLQFSNSPLVILQAKHLPAFNVYLASHFLHLSRSSQI